MSHPSFTLKELTAIAKKYSKVEMRTSRTGAVVFTEYGARVLGLFPDKKATNVLWNPQALDDNMKSGSWLIGGERLWISPERNYYYENPRDFEGHHVPPAMDPGEYAMSGDLVFENMSFPLLNLMSNEVYEGCYEKREFSSIADPYATGLDYAGVKITDTITVNAADVEMCAWSLAMVYVCGTSKPGTALFPIRKGGKPMSYFGTIPASRTAVAPGYARFKLDADEIYKLAIKPEDIDHANPCKAVYLSQYPDGKQWFCVVKRSLDMAHTQAECVDPAKGNPEGPRGAIQSYNAGPSPTPGMTFGEIEVQLQKGTHQLRRTSCTATHELLSYAGSKKDMLALAKRLLGISSSPALY